MEVLIFLIIVLGANFIFWSAISAVRFMDEKFFHSPLSRSLRKRKKEPRSEKYSIKPEQVAVLIPAYNEELVIADTIKSVLNLVPKENIFVNSYGSKDKTAKIAAGFGVNVLNGILAGKAKSEKLSNTVDYLKKMYDFKAVLFVDADTRISPDYLEKGLPHFSDPDVVAVAGYATTQWERKNKPFWNMYFVSYRERVYFFMQMIIKYAQTWRYTNVSPIIPGFASIYRMSILPDIDINAKGLVIEDFNMTFEVHRKKLGKIAHHPDVYATTQDPDNFRDYVRQISRWHLGFWQTVRRHGFWLSDFSLYLFFYIADILIGSAAFVAISAVFIFVFPAKFVPGILDFEWYSAGYNYINSLANVGNIFLAIFLLDYMLSIIVAIVQERTEYLYFGFGYLFLRFIDSVVFMAMLPKAFLVTSSGQWRSPARR